MQPPASPAQPGSLQSAAFIALQAGKTTIYIPTTLAALHGKSSQWSFGGAFLRWASGLWVGAAWPGERQGAPWPPAPWSPTYPLLPAILNALLPAAALWAARWTPPSPPTIWQPSLRTRGAATVASRRVQGAQAAVAAGSRRAQHPQLHRRARS